MSLPSRERGLKSYARTPTGQGVDVAPLAGAWIEISAFRGSRLSIASLPSRERGLKLDNKFKVGAAKESLPSRERGLK